MFLKDEKKMNLRNCFKNKKKLNKKGKYMYLPDWDHIHVPGKKFLITGYKRCFTAKENI